MPGIALGGKHFALGSGFTVHKFTGECHMQDIILRVLLDATAPGEVRIVEGKAEGEGKVVTCAAFPAGKNHVVELPAVGLVSRHNVFVLEVAGAVGGSAQVWEIVWEEKEKEEEKD